MSEHTESLKVWRCPECGEFEQSRNGRVDRWTRNTRYGYEPQPRHWHGEVGTVLRRYVPAEEVEVIPADSRNVLSGEEAALLVKARDHVLSEADFDAVGELCNRLEDWAAEKGTTE